MWYYSWFYPSSSAFSPASQSPTRGGWTCADDLETISPSRVRGRQHGSCFLFYFCTLLCYSRWNNCVIKAYEGIRKRVAVQKPSGGGERVGNMSEPAEKRLKMNVPMCKAHRAFVGSKAKQNFPAVVEEGLCGISTSVMEFAYRLEALVRVDPVQ